MSKPGGVYVDPAPRSGSVVVTPEAVAVSLDIAGLGSRGIALLIDTAIQGGVILLLSMAMLPTGAADTTGGLVLYLTLFFLIFWGYFPLFEGFWHGQTPGKRAQHLRVIRVDGQPARGGAVLIRNLLRIVDYLPSTYAIGMICVAVTSRSQRLGDLAAGTIVVRQRPAPKAAPAAVVALGPDGWAAPGSGLDAAAVTEREYGIVRAFLERRATLDPGARVALARQIAASLGPRVPGWRLEMGDEAFLELLARAYRERFAASGELGTGPPLPPPPGSSPARPDLPNPL
jgi:uncharacterized RDD family membrane protein YckC